MATGGFRSDIAHIGKSVVIKGELSGSEDLFFDGEVEGTIQLSGNSLTVGPNGRIRANINAREVVILGKVNGNVQATERFELRQTGQLNGDVTTARIVIEDGAFFKGSVEIQKAEKQETKPATTATPLPPTTSTAPGTSPTGAALAAGYNAQPVK